MSIRTTITLDEDVYERLKRESQARGTAFKQTVNDVLRSGLAVAKSRSRVSRFKIETYPLGVQPGVSYDNVEGLLELGEGEWHR